MNNISACDKRATVLLIDDDPMTTELFGEILAVQCDIRVANSLEDAMPIIKSEPLAAVISDYHIGQCSAETLFVWIQMERAELARRFILLTGDKLADLSIFEEQATVLFKPIPIQTLLDTVSRIIAPNQEMVS